MKKPVQIAGQSPKGFTLIEMLVVVAIIVVVTATVISNNVKFGGTILLQNLAYDIALSTRESQVYGISVLHFGNNFTAPFGIHFDRSNPTAYVVFADANGNGLYDSGELVQSTAITGGYVVAQLCAMPAGGALDCSPTKLDITYKHPEPDAYIRINGASALYQEAEVIVQAPRGDTLGIWIEANGQISVHN